LGKALCLSVALLCGHRAVDARFATGASLRLDLARQPAKFEGRNSAIVGRTLALRGGAEPKEKKKKNVGNSLAAGLQSITPTTRSYLMGCLAMAALTLVGIPEELFLYEFQRTFLKGQFWRPFTSSCFLGKVDMSMASQIYFLVNYGQEMERQDGSAQHCMFLLVQMLLLMGLATLTGYPSFARSLITASIYCCSRRQPMRPMEVQFGVRIEYWLLPYVNMVIDCLQAQSAAGAIPHVLGILTGHVYHFFSVIWPKMGGRRYLSAPGILSGAMGGGDKEEGAKGGGAAKSKKKAAATTKAAAASKSKKGDSKSVKAKKTGGKKQ